MRRDVDDPAYQRFVALLCATCGAAGGSVRCGSCEKRERERFRQAYLRLRVERFERIRRGGF